MNQTPFASRITFPELTRIKIPSNVVVHSLSAPSESNHPYYIIKDALIYKPIAKYFENEYDIDRGIDIEVVGGEVIKDVAPFGDYSTQHLGIITYGVFLAVLLKLFG